MRPAKFFEESSACSAPDRTRGQEGREESIKQTLNTFIETTKPQNLTDMEWISTLGGFKKISENWNTLEPSLRKDVSDLLLQDEQFKRALVTRSVVKAPDKKAKE